MSDIINRTQRDGDGALFQQFSVDTNTVDPIIWVINPDLSALTEVPKYYWENTPDTELIVEMNSDAKLVMDTWRLSTAKANKKQSLNDDGTYYLESRYSSSDRITLQLLYENSQRLRPNRKGYLTPFMNWLDMVATEVKTKQTVVDVATIIDDVNAVVLDTIPLDTSDPCVTVAAAMAVVDDLSLTNFLDANASVTDPVTGVSGPFDLMQLLLMRTDLYNDIQNPLYHSGQMPVLGSGGFMVDHANRISSLEAAVTALTARVAALGG